MYNIMCVYLILWIDIYVYSKYMYDMIDIQNYVQIF